MRKQIGGIECIVENPGTSTSQTNVVILFHGYGADFTDLAPLADMMDPDGDWTWIFPNGPHIVDIGYRMTGRAWFPINMEELQRAMMTGTPRDYAGSEPKELDQVLPQVEDMLKEIMADYTNVVIGGFSQGGMLATHLLKSVGPQLKGALLLSTVLLNSKKLLASLEGVVAKSFVQSHGSQDPVLHIKQGMDLYQLLKKNGWQGRWVEFSGGHEIPPVVLQKSKELLKSLL